MSPLTARIGAISLLPVALSRPWLDLDEERALASIDPFGQLGDVRDRDVLCLAGGGGQQTAAFAVAGARVAVLDISEGQLRQNRVAARHYGYQISTVQGDMRDLSAFSPGSFDIVYQPYSINFVPDCRDVFAEVATVLRPGGIYTFTAANPFAAGLGTSAWNGHAYDVSRVYIQGVDVAYEDEAWVLPDGPDHENRAGIDGPREYLQLLGTLLNGLTDLGFVLLHLREETTPNPGNESSPGDWEHFISVMPPWFHFWAQRTPSPAGLAISPARSPLP